MRKNYETKLDRRIRIHFDKIFNENSTTFKKGDKVAHINGDFTGIVESTSNTKFSLKICTVGDNCLFKERYHQGMILNGLPLCNFRKID